ncbi:transcriptional regulator [Shewanella sp. SHSM-M6]|uniref:Transcriptional regulator n=1 Tax=Shewanella salipaludis TaxID=2723052 RepID=A0A972JNY7_9GAMM|nr:winged helix-turn-helix domain-containing protein [Shewanella salipaludis]NMH66636.1 transcriptional regulator [Shewanella salipaludis]
MKQINYSYQFADLVLNTRLGTLVRNAEEEIKLPWLSYRLLCVLCEAAPAIVSQQQLIEAVWPDAVIGDETLKQRVKLLRKSLGDNATEPKYLEAIRGRGYRMLPQVQALERVPARGQNISPLDLVIDSHIPNLSGGAYPLNWRVTSALLLGMLLLMLSLALFSSYFAAPPKATQTTRLQSESFADELYDKGLEYYHRYRAEDNRHAIDLFHSAIEIEPQMARAYAGLADAYSQGVFQFNAPPQWQQLAIDSAYKAISLEPDLAQGYKALGLAYYNKGWLAKATSANLRALQKQPDYNEAMSNLGYIYREMGQLALSLDWTNRALEAKKDYSVSLVHKAQTLTALGDYPGARDLLDKALLLQPDSQLANEALGHWYMWQGKFSEAGTHHQTLLAVQPEQPAFVLGLAENLFYLGQLQQSRALALGLHNAGAASAVADSAVADNAIAASAATGSLNSSFNSNLNSNSVRQGALLALLTESEPSETEVQTLAKAFLNALSQGSDKPGDSWALAQIYAALGETATSRRYLIQAINQGWLAVELTLKHPSFAHMLQDPGFRRLITEMRALRQQQRTAAGLGND